MSFVVNRSPRELGNIQKAFGWLSRGVVVSVKIIPVRQIEFRIQLTKMGSLRRVVKGIVVIREIGSSLKAKKLRGKSLRNFPTQGTFLRVKFHVHFTSVCAN